MSRKKTIKKIEPVIEQWVYVGPDNITSIIVGDKTLVLRQLAQLSIETLISQHPRYAAWFKKI